jgi:hypothetical protein
VDDQQQQQPGRSWDLSWLPFDFEALVYFSGAGLMGAGAGRYSTGAGLLVGGFMVALPPLLTALSMAFRRPPPPPSSPARGAISL